jgi:hypothetical protein
MLATVVCTLAACVTTTATRLGQGRIRPAIAPDSVVIYLITADVPGRYEQVALLNSSGNVDYTNEQQMYNSMRKKAAELGANGVILDATNEPGTGAKIAQALFGVSANRKGKAVAIYVFKRDTMPAQP